MVKVDLDFQRYVERRKGARDAQTREGAAYAYAGDLKVLRTLDRLKPVRIAIEATERMWRSAARAELLDGAIKASEREYAKVHAQAKRAADVLHIAAPIVWVAPKLGRAALTLDTNEDAYVVIGAALVDELTEPELLGVLGRACAHVQNNHVACATALHYLRHFANRFVRWIVTPASGALERWARRAEITCDRAALLCSRSLDASEALLRKIAADDPRLEKRVQALRIFAESSYWKGFVGEQGGLSPSECDAKVAEIL